MRVRKVSAAGKVYNNDLAYFYNIESLQTTGNGLKRPGMRIKSQNSRSWLCLILLLALMARSVIPVGFMPGQGSSGKMQMVICTGHGPSTVLLDADKYSPIPEKDKKGNTGHNDLCPFAPVVAQDSAVHAPVVAPVFIAKAAAPVFTTAALLQGAPPKPWFSQGPPAA